MTTEIETTENTAIDKEILANVPFIGRKLALCADLVRILVILSAVAKYLVTTTDNTAECIALLIRANDIATKNHDVPEDFHFIYLALMQLVFNNHNFNAKYNLEKVAK